MKYTDIKQQINEMGRHDPYIFKAIFFAGGPGSGKSQVVKAILRNVSDFEAIKVFDVDTYYSFLAAKQGDINKIKGPDQEKLYTRAYEKLTKDLQSKLSGKLGLIFDSTGKDVNKIIAVADSLKVDGYDVMMIFVDTSIDTAIMRASQRERHTDKKFIIASHKQIRNESLPKLKQYFGSNFINFSNEKIKMPIDVSAIMQQIKSFLHKPVIHREVREWIINNTDAKFINEVMYINNLQPGPRDNPYYDPEEDEMVITPDDLRKKSITLRHLNKLRKMTNYKNHEKLAKQKQVKIQYGIPAEEAGMGMGAGGF